VDERSPQGKHINAPVLCHRFRSLVIPPGWSDVWICPDESGHIQVTGRDDLGRKQYIYHPRWEDIRNKSEVDLCDRRLARLVKECQELPGQRLVQYLDDDGQPQSVGSSDVNTYLRELTGAPIFAWCSAPRVTPRRLTVAPITPEA
jgi:DNA topoisomerase IB